MTRIKNDINHGKHPPRPAIAEGGAHDNQPEQLHAIGVFDIGRQRSVAVIGVCCRQREEQGDIYNGDM